MRANLVRGLSIVLLMGCLQGTGFGQAASDTAAKAQILAVLDDYFRLFGEGRADLISMRIYTAPSQSLGNGGIEVSMTSADVRARFEKSLAPLAAQGYARSERSATNVCVLNPSAAVASTRFKRLRRDNSVIGEFGATYVLGKVSNEWRIVSLIGHGPKNLLECASE